MNVLFTVIAVLVILAAILLTAVVLLQNGKGGGLASNFVAGNQTFGVRQTADILEKFTWGLAVFILILSVVSNFTFKSHSADSSIANDVKEKTEQQEQVDFSAVDALQTTQENPEE